MRALLLGAIMLTVGLLGFFYVIGASLRGENVGAALMYLFVFVGVVGVFILLIKARQYTRRGIDWVKGH